ncbi:MAG: beta-ketoacyl-[acyl-carrier-protein] synthase family protein, partial [Actinobacteria bacterium]|nr:beta-ketoacyl-[acyl-carrier-protein] synthase family protein [Actinomycetota bacterium]
MCAVARDHAELLDAIERGRDGIRRIGRFDTVEFHVHTGAEVPDWDGADPAESAWDRCLRFALRAAREAVLDAGISGVAPERIGLVFGTGLADQDRAVHELAEALADALGVRGPAVTISTACSSSATAVGIASDLLEGASADVVVAGGADVLTPEVFAGFHALGVLTPGKCAPFSDSFGTTLGEGAGFMVLERADTARRRKATPRAVLAGYGLSADGYHETSPDPYGGGVRRAVVAALSDAALTPPEVGYVNAHGSGTEANDPAEWRGISKALSGNDRVPVSSSKGALGHAQGAAGALEAIVTILAMSRDRLAPTLHFSGPRRFAPPDPVPGPRPRPARYRHALCLNSAFGGSNAALVLSRPAGGGPEAPSTARARAPVRILGMGLVGPFGLGIEAFRSAPRPTAGTVPDFELGSLA